ncbi:Cell division protein ZapE OS=Streptomyces alboniger OX=132473 GN=zapE PE=4 SV=1 [Streptomyces alboniger]
MSSSPAAPAPRPTAEAAPQSLCAREPHVPADRLVAEMVPPPRFDSVRFDTYIPDPGLPSQTEAVRALSGFAAGLGGAHASGTGRKRWFQKKAAAPTGPRGIYLDGGYGVGKTHLLASLWHATPAAPEQKAFGTFVELTNLVGALRSSKAATWGGSSVYYVCEYLRAQRGGFGG